MTAGILDQYNEAYLALHGEVPDRAPAVETNAQCAEVWDEISQMFHKAGDALLDREIASRSFFKMGRNPNRLYNKGFFALKRARRAQRADQHADHGQRVKTASRHVSKYRTEAGYCHAEKRLFGLSGKPGGRRAIKKAAHRANRRAERAMIEEWL